MESRAIRVLLVDDDQDYFVLTRALLLDIEPDGYELDWIERYNDALAALMAKGYDVCLLDYDLGERTGLEFLYAANDAGSSTPIIMLTGHGDHQIDVEAMQAGATDYVTKARIDAVVLERSIRYAIERTRAQQTLKDRERHIAELYRQEQDRSRELERAYADVRRAEAMRDDLSHMIVHDLRGPLTVILTSLNLISKVVGDPTRAESLPRLILRAQTNTARLVDMIDDLLKVSKLEAGALHPTGSPLHLPTLLAEKAPDYSTQASQDNKTFIQRIPADLPAVQADVDLIGRVIDNLVYNALKYTETGGRIEIAAVCQDGNLIVRVSDDGPGIPAEYQSRIFDKYFQATVGDGGSMRKGIGIGLTFCRLAVEAHGGRIWVDSVSGHGSVFSFTIPLKR